MHNKYEQKTQLSLEWQNADEQSYCLAICEEALLLFAGRVEGQQWRDQTEHLVDSYKLLIVTIPLIRFNRNMPCKFWAWV